MVETLVAIWLMAACADSSMQAASTARGVLCLGGRMSEAARQVQVVHDDAWNPDHVLTTPDCSQFFQV